MIRLPPVRRCIWCHRVFWIRVSWWWGYVRWGVPEYCSRECADAEMDWTDRVMMMEKHEVELERTENRDET